MSRGYAELAGAIRYGYAPYYLLQVEGIPTLLLEVAADAIAPAGYGLSSTLVIDSGARVGSVIDPRSHIGAGFDLEWRVLPGGFDLYITRPGKSSVLTAPINASTTTIPLAAASELAGQTPLFAGLETFNNPLAPTVTGLTGVTRGAFGRARSARIGTTVANRPLQWRGRKATLYLAMVDPSGAYVQGSDVLSDACVVWTGTIAERPVRDQGTWYFRAVEPAKRLNDPFSVAASGTVKVTLDDDAEVTVDLAATIEIQVLQNTPGAGYATATALAVFAWQPFVGLSNPIRLSALRAAIASTWATVTAASVTVGDLRWEQRTVPTMGVYRRSWRSSIEVTASGTDGLISTLTRIWGDTPFFQGPAYTDTVPIESTIARYELQLGVHSNVFRAALSVRLDSMADELPSPTGWLRLEGDGVSAIVAYTEAELDGVDPQVINLKLAPTPALDIFDLASAEVDGESRELSATFLWRAFGAVADVLRRIIVSGGDGTLGAYDTLGRGQGYSIEDLDEASFDEVFDGVFDALSLDLAQDAGDSLKDLFAGLLVLSGRGLTCRRAADGSAVNVAAVNVGSVGGGSPVVTLTDADLCDAGRAPVRPKTSYDAPQAIKLSVKTAPDSATPRDSQTITLRSPHLADYSTTTWEYSIYGLDRSALYDPAKAWALAWFRAGENRQIIELDVGPWHDVQPGDVIGVTLRDINVWDYATGSKGIVSLARVLGVQLSLDKGFQVLTVMVDGIYATRPLCPTMKVLDYSGSATNPTWVEVAGTYFDLCTRIRAAQSPMGCVVYLPGEDAGRSRYLFSAVDAVAGRTRLTRSLSPSSPTVALTTSHYLTWPHEEFASLAQSAYTHVADGTQWS